MSLFKWMVLMCFAVMSFHAHSEVMLRPGETYTYSFTSLEDVVSISPGLPAYDDYSFTLALSGDLYNKPPDDIRIRLYEDPFDLIPVHNIFGESVPNLSESPSSITIFQLPGTLWYDRDGRVEVEVFSGSVNLHHLYIDLGVGQASYSSYIEAVPEPGSMALVLIGTGGLCLYRRSRRGARNNVIRAAAVRNIPFNVQDRF